MYILEILKCSPNVDFFLASLTGFTNLSNLLFKIYSIIISSIYKNENGLFLKLGIDLSTRLYSSQRL